MGAAPADLDDAPAGLSQPIGAWLGWLGVSAGSMSAVSAITRAMETGVAGVFADLLAYYQSLLAPIHRLIELAPLPFRVPPVAVDLGALYIVLLAMAWRASFAPFLAAMREYNRRAGTMSPEPTTAPPRNPYYRLPARVIFWLLLWPILSLQPVRMWRTFDWEYRLHRQGRDPAPGDPISTALAYRKWGRDLYWNASMQLVALPIAVALFFAANAYSRGGY